jgi:hypothetical protein
MFPQKSRFREIFSGVWGAARTRSSHFINCSSQFLRHFEALPRLQQQF